MNKRAGKAMAERMPIRRLFWKVLETAPAKVGPPEQPRSPARASRANMAVPPPLMEAVALEQVDSEDLTALIWADLEIFSNHSSVVEEVLQEEEMAL